MAAILADSVRCHAISPPHYSKSGMGKWNVAHDTSKDVYFHQCENNMFLCGVWAQQHSFCVSAVISTQAWITLCCGQDDFNMKMS
ncbi:hypothetical protein E2C01_026340 [Portunus trituberculatus]|uniref:Uncharacterized protein n=1 Tax=Portunus trituberculatus TaxID=210409 RepID=A0A5B7EFR2_PORTR|nr:hypothetical protein [Portunus trituberculatus]